MALYLMTNGPMPTTAKVAPVTTGTAIKTLLQVKPSATILARIVEWGFALDGATAGSVELLETDVAATVSAFALADIHKYDSAALCGGDQTTNLIQIGTTSSGYTSTGEGTITAVRLLDLPFIVSAGSPLVYVKQFPLGREPVIQIGKFGRIRVHVGTAVNALCHMVVEV